MSTRRGGIPRPGLVDAESQVAVPAMVLGQLLGVVVVESSKPGVYGLDDEALLTVVGRGRFRLVVERELQLECVEGDE